MLKTEWEITIYDIANVFLGHNDSIYGIDDPEALEIILDEIDLDEIMKKVMQYENFDDRIDAMHDDIEDYLFDEGYLAPLKKKDNKMFFAPKLKKGKRENDRETSSEKSRKNPG